MTRPPLKGMTWSHPRGLDPLLACSSDYLRAFGVEIKWDARSLQDFADFPLEQLTDEYDLIVFDHPFVGEIAESNLFLPLDSVFPPGTLQELAGNSVGQSHLSYRWAEHQWAVAIDAACHVSVRRPDLHDASLPQSWEEVIEEGRARKHRNGPLIALPLLPIDSYLALLTIVAGYTGEPFASDGRWADNAAASAALDQLARLREVSHPRSVEWNPIQMLEVMSSTDDIAYAPITFGYVNYSTPGFRQSALSFDRIPTRTAAGGVLGGAGLGISASTAFPEEAADFAQYVASDAVQAGHYAAAGGQPGHRVAWLDRDVNQRTRNFFRDTLWGMDLSYLRPRWPGYLQAQTTAGELVHEWLTTRSISSEQLARQLSAVFGKTFDLLSIR